MKESAKSGTKVLKNFLFKEYDYGTSGENVEYLVRGSELMPHACKHVLVHAKACPIYDMSMGNDNVK